MNNNKLFYVPVIIYIIYWIAKIIINDNANKSGIVCGARET